MKKGSLGNPHTRGMLWVGELQEKPPVISAELLPFGGLSGQPQCPPSGSVPEMPPHLLLPCHHSRQQ